MATTEDFKNLLLDASDINILSLHNGDPGSSGTSNEITSGGYERESATFASASGGEKALSADVEFTATAGQEVTHLGLWSDTTFRGSAELSGDLSFNSEGKLKITTGTKIILTDV